MSRHEPAPVESPKLVIADDGPAWDLLAPGQFLLRRIRGTYTVDEWGLDRDLVRVVAPIGRARWIVDGDGLDHLPHDGPALLVHNLGWGWSEVGAVSAGVHRATGRVVRFVGVPDIAPIGPALRRFGGVLDRVDEVRGLLRAGELVSAGAGREVIDRRHVGPIRPETVAPAIEAGVPVIPVAALGFELGVRWRVVFGEPLPVPEHGDAFAADQLAEDTRRAIQDLLSSHPRRRLI